MYSNYKTIGKIKCSKSYKKLTQVHIPLPCTHHAFLSLRQMLNTNHSRNLQSVREKSLLKLAKAELSTNFARLSNCVKLPLREYKIYLLFNKPLHVTMNTNIT